MIKYRGRGIASDESDGGEPSNGGFFTNIFGFGKKKHKREDSTTGNSRGSVTLGELRRRQQRGMISSNPNESVAVRWGDIRGPSEKAARCPTY